MTQNATNTSNPITVAQGGTGLATLTAHAVYVGNGTSSPTALAVGASNSILMGNSGADPAFTTSGTPYVSGISFNSGTNTLSTYITGTWTPAISFGGGTTGITYSTQAGTYIQIGNTCWISGQVVLTSKGSSTGAVLVTGLPVTVNTATNCGLFLEPSSGITFDAGYTYLCGISVNSSTTAGIYESGSNKTIAQLNDTNFANASGFTITGTYQV